MGNSENPGSTEVTQCSLSEREASVRSLDSKDSAPNVGRRLVRYLAVALLGAGFFFGHRYWTRSWEQTYLMKCREARDARQWPELRRISEQWGAWDRSNADATLFLADAANHLRDFETAARCLALIPESHPKSLPSLVALSTLQFGPLNQPIDGVRTCERILKLDRRATAAHQQLIEFYAVTLQRRKLEHQIRFAIECSREPPKAYIYLFLMDTMRISGASESNTRWLEQSPESELFAVARVLHMPEPDSGLRTPSGDDKYSLVDALFKRFPGNLELLAYKVDVSLRSGDIQEVTSLLSSLPPEADDDNRFWRAKGWLHLNRNELTKARDALNEAVHLFPMDWNARNLLADVLRRESLLADAEKLHDLVQSARQLRIQINAIALDSEIPTEVLTELARLAKQCGDAQVADALNRRLGLAPSDAGGGHPR
ncbi:MAG: hypothetical protein JSS49_08160 [Planctomycetes bacterium]|nr:hypothetical protein [Planctomycetota bacterium]